MCVYWTLSMPFKQQQTHGNNFDQQTCSKQEDNNEPPCSVEVSENRAFQLGYIRFEDNISRLGQLISAPIFGTAL